MLTCLFTGLPRLLRNSGIPTRKAVTEGSYRVELDIKWERRKLDFYL